jgi:hypothetical protein
MQRLRRRIYRDFASRLEGTNTTTRRHASNKRSRRVPTMHNFIGMKVKGGLPLTRSRSGRWTHQLVAPCPTPSRTMDCPTCFNRCSMLG